ncbi:MAG: glycosyltransferase, partial [Candidatus Moraniibacteriota bacterium]
MNEKSHKIALVHDFLLAFGGAERVLKELSSMYPEAPIYTLLENQAMTGCIFPGRVIRTSFLQKFPKWLRKRYWLLTPFFPVAVETFDLRDFDLVISSSGAWSKGIVTRLNTRHIAYLHSPTRFFWDSHHWHPALREKRQIFRRLLMSYIRLWDKEAADRPDVLVANSEYTASRIQKYYRRDSVVIYPPVAPLGKQEEDTLKEEKNYFLVVSRLTEAKRVDVVIDAFNKLNLPLVIVGTGREMEKLK